MEIRRNHIILILTYLILIIQEEILHFNFTGKIFYRENINQILIRLNFGNLNLIIFRRILI